MNTDEFYMQQCLQLAEKGLGYVAPNPLVGCVIVHEDQVIGKGYHQKFGKSHAEVNAIYDVSESNKHLLSTSTLYVNLEPCTHYGKTPPCADLIIEKKIPKVVIANKDINPLVAGKGIEKLRENGIAVITDVLKDEAYTLNKRFFTFFENKRPYIILKWAHSSDNFFAKNNEEQTWLTGNEAKKIVHLWRGQEAAILVGKQTALTDNPLLTNRYHHHLPQPVRVVIDKNLQLPLHLNIFNQEAKTIVLNSIKSEQKNNIQYTQIPFQNTIVEILQVLYENNIQSVIIEGGANTLNRFIDENLWNEARVFTAPVKLNNGIKAPLLNATIFNEEKVGNDILKVYKRS